MRSRPPAWRCGPPAGATLVSATPVSAARGGGGGRPALGLLPHVGAQVLALDRGLAAARPQRRAALNPEPSPALPPALLPVTGDGAVTIIVMVLSLGMVLSLVMVLVTVLLRLLRRRTPPHLRPFPRLPVCLSALPPAGAPALVVTSPPC